jgi:hypothetical protein
MKKWILGVAAFAIIFSCKQEEKLLPTKATPDLAGQPIIGLTLAQATAPIAQMIQDPDSEIDNLNFLMNQMAQAFMAIACDPGFDAAVANEVNAFLEFSVDTFLINNVGYKTIIEQELIAMGTSYPQLMSNFTKQSNQMDMRIYAANFGAHDADAPPILALAVEVEEQYLNDLSDFIPAYYSETDCSNYTEWLLGFESDLGPEDPSLPTRALTIIFDYTFVDVQLRHEDVDVTDFEPNNPSGGTNGSSSCEAAPAYTIDAFSTNKSFSKGKKMRVAVAYVSSFFGTSLWFPNTAWEGNFGTHYWTLWYGNKNSVVNQGITLANKRTIRYDIIGNATALFTNPLPPFQFNNDGMTFGCIHERDWYALRRSIRFDNPKGSSKEHIWLRYKNEGVISYFFVRSRWCAFISITFINSNGSCRIYANSFN